MMIGPFTCVHVLREPGVVTLHCTFEVVLPVLPSCARQLHVDKCSIWPDDGQGCSCYKEKGVTRG